MITAVATSAGLARRQCSAGAEARHAAAPASPWLVLRFRRPGDLP